MTQKHLTGRQLMAESREYVEINRAMKDLSRVRRPEEIVSLEVTTKRLESTEGVERMVNLERHFHWGVGDLPPLAGCPRLAEVFICADAQSDLTFLESLPELRELNFDVRSRAGADAISRLDLGSARHLRWLTAGTTPHGVRWPLDLEWVARAPALIGLRLYGLYLSPGSLDMVLTMRQLTDVTLTADGWGRDAELKARLRRALPGPHMDVALVHRRPIPKVVDCGPDGSHGYALYVDLVELWGSETNHDAAFELLDRLDGDVRGEISVDPEADGVGVYSDDRSVLEAVFQVIKTVSEDRR